MFRRWAFKRRWNKVYNVKPTTESAPVRMLALLNTFTPTLFKHYLPAHGFRVPVNTITENIETLINSLEMCIDVVVENTAIPKAIVRLPEGKPACSLDDYLVTQKHYSVSPEEAVEALRDRATRLVNYLFELKQAEPSRHTYCLRMFTHVFNDVLIVTEALRDAVLKPKL